MTVHNSVMDMFNCILCSHSCILKLLHLQPYLSIIMCIHNENIDIHNWSMAIHNWKKDIHNWNINFYNWILDVHNWIMDTHNWIIKSPSIQEVTCFCTGLYAPTPPTTLGHCSLDNFRTNFPFWSIFVVTLTLNWIFKVKYRICYNSATNGPIATIRKANILFVLLALSVIMRFDLGHGLDLKFSRSNMKFAISQPNMVRLPWNEKQTHRLNSKQQMQSSGLTLAMTLTLDFQGQILKRPYLRNRKANWHLTTGVIHDHARDLFMTKMRCKELLPDSDHGDFICRRAVDLSCWYP